MTRGISEFMDWVAATVTADSAVSTLCQAQFHRDIVAFVGQDQNALPESTECPMLILTPGARQLTDDGNLKTREIRVTVAISDERKLETVSGRIKRYPGIAVIDNLADLVVKAIRNAVHSSGYYVQWVTPGPDDSIEFPVYKAFFGISVQFDSEY